MSRMTQHPVIVATAPGPTPTARRSHERMAQAVGTALALLQDDARATTLRGSLRDGHAISPLEAIALMRYLREHAAKLQLAAERLAECTQAEIGAVARDAYEQAVREADVEQAVEAALQPFFELFE